MEAVRQGTLALGKLRVSRASILGLFSCSLAATSCDKQLASDPLVVDRIVLAPCSASMQVGATLTLTAAVFDAAGNAMRDRKVVWASEKPNVATVSQSGVVVALAAGDVRIAASSGGKSASATITISARPVSLVRITPGSATISVGGAIPLQAQALDASGAVVLGRPVSWSSSNETIAVVSTSGIVAGLSAGSVTITATIEGRAGTAAIAVAPQPVASVTITPAVDTALVGGRVTLRATALDAQGRPLADRFVLWSSSSPDVATVSSEGEVIALAVGSAQIRATVEGKFADAAIVVNPVPVARVVVTPNQLTLNPGQTSQLSVTLSDSAGTVLVGRSVSYTTSDAQIASVSASGLVIGVAEGAATIQVASEGKTATAAVTVNPIAVASVSVTPNAASLAPAQSTRLVAQALDAQGRPLANRTYVWSSDDVSIASVNQSGDVTAVSAGTVAIKATSGGQTGSAAVSVSSPPISSTIVQPRAQTISVGGTAGVRAVVVNGGVVARSSAVTWQSRAAAIVSVTPVTGFPDSATVTGVSLGTAYVVASDRSGASDSSLFAVTSVPVVSVAVSPATTSLAVSATAQLSAVASDSSGGTLTPAITWVSLAPSVATVSATGLVTATGSGSATIEARANGAGANGADVVGSAAVTVTQPTQPAVNSVVVTSPRSWIVPGDSMHLTVVLRDAQNNILTGRAITFTSSSASRMSVDAAGVVTGIATSGNSDILATSEGKSGKVQLDAEEAVATMRVTGPQNNPLDLVIPRGGKKRYTVTVQDGRARGVNGVTVTLSSNNPALLSFSSTTMSTNGSGQAQVDISAGNTIGLATITFTAARAGAIPPWSAGNNNPLAILTILVP